MSLLFRGTATSFRIPGLASTPHNLFSVSNKQTADNGLWLAIYAITLYKDTTTALATNTPMARVSVPTALPTAGTVLTVSRDLEDTGRTSVGANAEFMCAASADGTADAMTATAGTPMIWQAHTLRMHTLAGEVASYNVDCLPPLTADSSGKTRPAVVLNGGERILLQLVNAGTTGDHNVISCLYEEWSTETG